MSNKDVQKAVAAIAKQMAADTVVAESADDLRAARMAKTNTKGEMLLCDFQLAKQEGRPDPLCITVVDQVKWVKRGAKVKLPWYFVEHLLHNVERKFKQGKDAQGNRIVEASDLTTEQFQYRAIDPAINPVTDTFFEIEGPREQVVQSTF